MNKKTKEEIHEILRNLNRGRMCVDECQDKIFEIIEGSNVLFPTGYYISKDEVQCPICQSDIDIKVNISIETT